jgi:putative inorganic carbon (HCO3(-)) transporter
MRRITGDVLDSIAFGSLVVAAIALPLVFWPWSIDVFVGPKFGVLRTLTAIGAIASIGFMLVGTRRFRLRLSDWAVIAFLVFNAIAYSLSIDRATSLLGEPLQQLGIATMFAFAGAYAIARISVRTASKLLILVGAAAVAGTAVALYGIIQAAGGDPIWSDLPKGRVFSSLGQPNWLAGYLVITVPLTMALAASATRRVLRALGAGAALLQVAVLTATLSRSGYLGLLAAAAIAGVILWREGIRTPRHPKRFLAGAAVAILLFGGLLAALSRTTPAVAPATLAGRATSALDVGGFDAGRYLALWEVGVAIAAEHPLVGTGQDTYAILFPAYRDEVLEPVYAQHFADFRPESPHNAYIALAAGMGIPTLVAYLLVIGGAIVAMAPYAGLFSRESVLITGILVAVGAHIVTDWFVTIDLAGSWLFWVLMGSALALIDAGARRGSPRSEATQSSR